MPYGFLAANSKANAGASTGPGAGAVITTVTPGDTGWFEIQATAGYGGVAGVINNMKLVVGGADQMTLAVVPTTNFLLCRTFYARIVSAIHAVEIKAVAADAGTGVFLAELVVTKMASL